MNEEENVGQSQEGLGCRLRVSTNAKWDELQDDPLIFIEDPAESGNNIHLHLMAVV
jgi:hypothetical protein